MERESTALGAGIHAVAACGFYKDIREAANAMTGVERSFEPDAESHERYANIFQRCFLTPGREVRQRFAEITAGQTHLTRRHVILLAYALGVSREALVRRLEELGLARTGTWDWFVSNGGITREHVVQVLGDESERSTYRPMAAGLVPPRLALLAREAWKKELFSEGQLAGMLKLDIRGIREVLDGAEREESEADDLVRILR